MTQIRHEMMQNPVFERSLLLTLLKPQWTVTYLRQSLLLKWKPKALYNKTERNHLWSLFWVAYGSDSEITNGKNSNDGLSKLEWNVKGDVKWPPLRLDLPVNQVFVLQFAQTDNKETSKVSFTVPLSGESTGDQWIPRTKGRGKCFHLMTS